MSDTDDTDRRWPRDPETRGSGDGGRGAERGVSFTVSYVITLAITVLLIGGVILAAGQVVRDERASTVRDQATVAGDTVAASVLAADRLVAGGGTETSVTVAADLPTRLAGEPYAIELTDAGPRPAVVVRTTTPSVTVRVPLRSATAIQPNAVTGGPVRIVYQQGTGNLTVREGSA